MSFIEPYMKLDVWLEHKNKVWPEEKPALLVAENANPWHG